eukprot:12415210-Alexandrium_andersonii.AAC.1
MVSGYPGEPRRPTKIKRTPKQYQVAQFTSAHIGRRGPPKPQLQITSGRLDIETLSPGGA